MAEVPVDADAGKMLRLPEGSFIMLRLSGGERRAVLREGNVSEAVEE